MDKQVLTRRGLFVLGLVAVTGQALASDEGHGGSAGRRHGGYKVGGGMVLLVMAAVLASMAVFGEFRRHHANRRAAPLPPPPAPLPEGAEWDALDDSDDSDIQAPALLGPRRRRTRRKHSVERSQEH